MNSAKFLGKGLTRREILTGAVGTALASALPLRLSAASAHDLDTIESGVLKVASYSGGMPYVGKDGDKLVGFEGELMNEAARVLDLRVEVSEAPFATLLNNIQSRRVDVGLGSIGWNQKRCETGLFTDPVYYSQPGLATRPDLEIRSIEDLSGRTVAAVVGSAWGAALEKNFGNVTVRYYDDLPALIGELVAKRVDVVMIDVLALLDAKRKRPDLAFKVATLPPPSQELLKANSGAKEFLPFMACWYVPLEQPKLVNALNSIIRGWYASGYLADAISGIGGDPAAWLTPTPFFAADRIPLDRPVDWIPPSI